jgi:membrane-bound serine protease (ClpP class)
MKSGRRQEAPGRSRHGLYQAEGRKSMKYLRITTSCLLLIAGCVLLSGGLLLAEDEPAPAVVRITLEGAINPVSADYIRQGIAHAEETGASLLVLRLDTPGGLVSSTRSIVKAMWASKVPVAVHVWPPGAHAASAGTFITMAGHIAAMAPGTNMGAAHPVNVGGGSPFGEDEKEEEDTEDRTQNTENSDGNEDGESPAEEQPAQDDAVMAAKVLNDTVAFIRSIAERTGRNADWAERAVRESVTITGEDAVAQNVIDVVAEDTQELLEKIEGMTVKVGGEEVTLTLTGAQVADLPMNWRYRILATISDPNIAYILMMLGIYGIFFELSNPGVVLPGVLGAIFLILAFFSFQVLSINYAGVLLILLGLVLFILEVKVVSFGMLTVGGIVSVFLGSLMLFEDADPYVKLSLSLVLAVTIFTAAFVVLGLTLVIRTARTQVTTGMQGMVGEEGVVTVDLSPLGKVRVHGEIWSAVAERELKAGDEVVVRSMDGMVLNVGPKEDKDV